MRNAQKTSLILIVSAFFLQLGITVPAYAESAGQYMDDATVTAKVKAALIADRQLKPTQVSVETDQGAVELSGTVDTKEQEAEAVRVANQINGVKLVKDLLTVRNVQE